MMNHKRVRRKSNPRIVKLLLNTNSGNICFVFLS